MRKLMIVAAVLSLPACGSGGNPNPPTTLPPVASFAITVTPNPIVAQDCTPAVCSSTPGAQFFVAAGITVTESGGVGGTVNFITLVLRNAANSEVGTLNFSAADIIGLVGTNRVNGRASLIIRGIGAAYRMSDGGRQGSLAFTVGITDDRGNPQNQSVSVPVV